MYLYYVTELRWRLKRAFLGNSLLLCVFLYFNKELLYLVVSCFNLNLVLMHTPFDFMYWECYGGLSLCFVYTVYALLITSCGFLKNSLTYTKYVSVFVGILNAILTTIALSFLIIYLLSPNLFTLADHGVWLEPAVVSVSRLVFYLTLFYSLVFILSIVFWLTLDSFIYSLREAFPFVLQALKVFVYLFILFLLSIGTLSCCRVVVSALFFELLVLLFFCLLNYKYLRVL